jgi:hypothetical protein
MLTESNWYLCPWKWRKCKEQQYYAFENVLE